MKKSKKNVKVHGLTPIVRTLSLLFAYRIPGPFIYMSLNKKETIVLYLVRQSTPTYVNKVTGYSIIAPCQLNVVLFSICHAMLHSLGQ